MTKTNDTISPDAHLSSLKDFSKQVRNRTIFFILFNVYAFLNVVATTDKDIFLLNPIKMPLLNIELPLIAFYIIIPLILVSLHFNLMYKLLSYRTFLERSLKDYKQAIDSLPFGIYEEILLGKGLFLKNILKIFFFFITYLTPIIVLLTFWYRFADYHDFVISSYHLLLAFASFVVAFYFVLHKRVLRSVIKTDNYLKIENFIKKRLSEKYFKILSKLLRWFVYYVIPLILVSILVWAFIYPYHLIIKEVSKDAEETINEKFIEEKEKIIKNNFKLLTARFGFIGKYMERPVLNVSGEILVKGVDKETLEILREFKNGDKPLLHYVLSTNYSGRNFSFANLTGSILINSDLKNVNLYRANLRNTNLSGVDLINANISETDLSETNLSGADLEGANLSRTELWGLNLSGFSLNYANLSEAGLGGANLSGASLWGANLSGAYLEYADLSEAYLTDADLSEAILWEANLSGADLRNIDLSEASLWGANLSGARLVEANLSGADLEGANLSRTELWGLNLSGFSLNYANLFGAYLRNVNLSRAYLGVANLSRADLRNIDLSEASLWGANLSGAYLGNSNLSGVELGKANLSGADLEKVNLSGADLEYANLCGSYVEEVDFSGAILENAKLKGICGNKNCNKPAVKRLYKEADLSKIKNEILTEEKIKEIIEDWEELTKYWSETEKKKFFEKWKKLLYQYKGKTTLEWIKAQDVELGEFTEEDLREFLRALILGLNKDDFMNEFRAYIQYIIENKKLSKDKIPDFIKNYFKEEREIISKIERFFEFGYFSKNQALRLLDEIEKELIEEYGKN